MHFVTYLNHSDAKPYGQWKRADDQKDGETSKQHRENSAGVTAGILGLALINV